MTSQRNRRTVLLVLVALLPAAVLLPACAPSDNGSAAALRRDSAGIQVVESFRPAWGDAGQTAPEAWRIDPEPLLDLSASGRGDAHNFYQVRDVKRLRDGSLVVANRGSNEIRKFSAEGTLVGTAGGDGEGPGEFRNLQQVESVGDLVLARDIRSRVTLFGPDLRHVRTLQLPPGVRDLHDLGNGTMVAQVIGDQPEVYGLLRPPEALLVYDVEGSRVDSIGRTAGSEEYVADALMGFPLFGKASVVDTHRDRLFVGSSDHMQVEELNSRGDTVRILRIPDFPLALTAEQVEAERNARLDIPLPPGVTSLPPPFVQAIEDMPSPETRPAYAAMLVDPTGAVWLRPFRGSSEEDGGPEHWLVLGPDGALLGSVEIPEGFRVMEIGVDEVLGVWTDELDVQHPQVLRLRRGDA